MKITIKKWIKSAWSFFDINHLADTILFFRWFVITRIISGVIIGASMIFLLAIDALDFDPRPIFLYLIPLYVAINLFWLLLIKRGALLEIVPKAQFIIDLLFITVGIWITGGINSEFIFLYILVVLSAAVISLKAVANTILTTLTFLILFIWIHSLYVPIPHGIFQSLEKYEIVRISVFLIILLNITFQGYYFISRIREKNKELARIKEEFFFRVIHDLRSPLTAIRWIAEKYPKPEFFAQHPELKEDFATIQQLSVQLLCLLKDCHAVIKEEETSMKLRKERVDITDILKNVLKELAGPIAKKEITVVYSPQKDIPTVLGDTQAIQEIFSNLLDNAVKYNRDGGSITIVHASDGKYLKTAIEDTGCGIAKENTIKLFTPFFRGDSQQNIPSTGLGLYIVRKLIEKMDGRINVVSTPGKGSIFSVYLPLFIFSGRTPRA